MKALFKVAGIVVCSIVLFFGLMSFLGSLLLLGDDSFGGPAVFIFPLFLIVVPVVCIFRIVRKKARNNIAKQERQLSNTLSVKPQRNLPSQEISRRTNNVPAPIRNRSQEHETFSDKILFQDIRPEVISLLWFANGPRKNYTPMGSSGVEVNIHGIKWQINFGVASISEPSAIDLSLPIEPVSSSSILQFGYYPAYTRLTPQQRYAYLTWLKDVAAPTDMGCDFIFILLDGGFL